LNFLTNFAPLREEMFLGLSCDGFQEGDLMQRENEIATTIVDAAFHVHRALGPGLLESAYEAIMVHELRKRGLAVETQVPVPVVYESVRLDAGFRADLIVEDSVIVELKSLEKIAPVHKKQLTTYLRLAGKRLGLLINFGDGLIKDGIMRVVNGMPD
jgi:GxxExxY protein